MSFLFNYGIESYFSRQFGSSVTSPLRWTRLAGYISDRLSKTATFLDNVELVFEASDASDLAKLFSDFHESASESPEDFSALWDALREWADQSVTISGREKTLVKIPHLPHCYSW